MEQNLKCPKCGSANTKDHVYSREAKATGLRTLPAPMLARMAVKGATSHEDNLQEYYISWRCEDCRHAFLDPKSARQNMADERPMLIRGAIGVAIFLLPALILLVMALFEAKALILAALLLILAVIVAVPTMGALKRYRQNKAEAIEVEQAQQ